MTTTSARTAPDRAPSTPRPRRGGFADLGWITRHEWAWLIGIAVVGAVARAGGFSSGTLYRDDAWVALTTRVPLATAARMVVTTPGFVLGERAWIGWFPHSVWLEQLPTFVASVLGIVAVGRLARWWGLSVPASLVAAGLVAVAESDVVYATRIKPYAFDVLGACLILWLAERCRRQGFRGAPWLAAASIVVCAFSLTPVPLVIGVWVVIGVEAVLRRRLSAGLVASAAVTALGLLVLWLAVRGGISPRLRTSWDGYYLVTSSAHGLAHSARTIVSGLLAGFGVTTPQLGIRGLGTIDRVAILALFVVGLVRCRRQLLPLAAIASAVICSIPSLEPLGTGRTDAYLYPAIAMVVAEGATVAWRGVRKLGQPVAVGVLVASLVFGGLLAADRVLHRPTYPGGDFRPVSALITMTQQGGGLVVVGGTARWPWAYYDAHRVVIRHSSLFNNGYTPLSDSPNVIVIPGSAIEGGYRAASLAAALRVARARPCSAILYVEAGDWPSMPMTLLRLLTTVGRHKASPPVRVGGYRVWTLAGRSCALGAVARAG